MPVIRRALAVLVLFLGVGVSCSNFREERGDRWTSTNATHKPFLVLPKFVIRFGFGSQPTVSKFPPIIELLVQRIQAQFSNYVYEDLSRPPTYDRPDYTSEETPDESDSSSDAVAETDPPLVVITPKPPKNPENPISLNITLQAHEELEELEEDDLTESELLFEKIESNSTDDYDDDYELPQSAAVVELLFEKIPKSERKQLNISVLVRPTVVAWDYDDDGDESENEESAGLLFEKIPKNESRGGEVARKAKSKNDIPTTLK